MNRGEWYVAWQFARLVMGRVKADEIGAARYAYRKLGQRPLPLHCKETAVRLLWNRNYERCSLYKLKARRREHEFVKYAR